MLKRLVKQRRSIFAINAPWGSLAKLSGGHKFPQRPKEGRPGEREHDWPYQLPSQKMKKLPYK
eukprot:8033230-Pyramimonas_sp.AAC.1